MRACLNSLSVLALAASASSALAADLPARMPVKAPLMVPVAYNWTGFYIGGNVGYSWGRDPVDLAGGSTVRTRQFRAFGLPAETLISDVTVAGPAFAGSGTADINGAVGGGQIGYNWQSAQWV